MQMTFGSIDQFLCQSPTGRTWSVFGHSWSCTRVPVHRCSRGGCSFNFPKVSQQPALFLFSFRWKPPSPAATCTSRRRPLVVLPVPKNRRPKINEIVVKIFIELFQNFFLGGGFQWNLWLGRCMRARSLVSVFFLKAYTPACWRWIDDGWPSGKWETRTDCPPSIFHFFFRSKNLLCVPPLWPWSGRRLIPPKKNFSQIQLLSIGRANNKKLNQVKKKKKAEASISRATPWFTTGRHDVQQQQQQEFTERKIYWAVSCWIPRKGEISGHCDLCRPKLLVCGPPRVMMI